MYLGTANQQSHTNFRPVPANFALSWRFMFRRALLLACFFCAVVASTTAAGPVTPAAYKIVHVYPHDSQAFTQGLIYVDGHLYESTGLNGRSSLRMEELSTGRVLQHYDLPAEYFGEGLTAWGSTLIQLTWKSHTRASSMTALASPCCGPSTMRAKGGG